MTFRVLRSQAKNLFEFFQKMPFYLMAPNGNIIEWSPKSSQEIVKKIPKRKRNEALSPDRSSNSKRMSKLHDD